MEYIARKAYEISKIPKTIIAKKMGVSRAYITQILSGDRNMTLKTITDFCICCGFELDLKLKRINVHGKTTSIPAFLKWLCWDADFSRLNPVEHRRYLLQRILDRGDTKAVQWMRKTYTKRQICNFINKNKSRLEARSLNFWAVIHGKEEQWTTPLRPSRAVSWQRLEKVNP